MYYTLTQPILVYSLVLFLLYGVQFTFIHHYLCIIHRRAHASLLASSISFLELSMVWIDSVQVFYFLGIFENQSFCIRLPYHPQTLQKWHALWVSKELRIPSWWEGIDWLLTSLSHTSQWLKTGTTATRFQEWQHACSSTQPYLIRGFSRNTGGYFTSYECIFPRPVGTWKNASNE
jgi:hypothetical protein